MKNLIKSLLGQTEPSEAGGASKDLSDLTGLDLEAALARLAEIQTIEGEVNRQVDALASLAEGDDNIFLGQRAAPWLDLEVETISVPSMISDEERRYFKWLAAQHKGEGAVVELGPWLGCSTNYIQMGLDEAPSSARLQVYDDFVWRASWMDGHVEEAARLPNHASFLDLFWSFNESLRDKIDVHRTKFVDYDGNESVDQFSWDGGKIDLLFVDCGRTLDANNAWYRALKSHFVAGETIIVMQDFGVCYEVPRMWYNQTRNFVGARGDAFRKLHDVSEGCLATYLFRGGEEPTV